MRPLTPLCCSATLVILVACGGSTSPSDSLSGTYDFTAALDTFTFETAAPDPPDCPDNGTGFPYCHHQRADSRATLSGTFVVGDQRQAGADGIEYLLASASADGTFCSSFNGTDGCTTFEPAHLDYPIGILVVEGPEPGLQFQQSLESLNRVLTVNASLITPDSIKGRVVWSDLDGRDPPAHIGRFVARRR